MERTTSNARRERGSALFVAVMMLVLMGFLGFAALDRVTRDQQVAGYQNRSREALYAAEAGVAAGTQLITSGVVFDRFSSVAFPDDTTPVNIGDVTLYDREGGGLPQYYGDPLVSPAIAFKKMGVPQEGMGLKSPLRPGLWQLNVVGRSADGSQVRLETIEAVLMPGNYR